MSTVAGTQRLAAAVIGRFSTSVPNIHGALLASPDGRPLVNALPSHDPRSTAAIVASSRGLGERLAELAGAGGLAEIVVRSSTGYVVIYSVGKKGALTVLTNPNVNLAMVHLRAREVTDQLMPFMDHLMDHVGGADHE